MNTYVKWGRGAGRLCVSLSSSKDSRGGGIPFVSSASACSLGVAKRHRMRTYKKIGVGGAADFLAGLTLPGAL